MKMKQSYEAASASFMVLEIDSVLLAASTQSDYIQPGNVQVKGYEEAEGDFLDLDFD